MIDHSGVDLWVTSKHVPYIELGVPFSERKLYQVKAVPGVQDAEKFILRWTQWKREDGQTESVQILGFNPDKPLGGPWNLVEGRVADFRTVWICLLYLDDGGVGVNADEHAVDPKKPPSGKLDD